MLVGSPRRGSAFEVGGEFALDRGERGRHAGDRLARRETLELPIESRPRPRDGAQYIGVAPGWNGAGVHRPAIDSGEFVGEDDGHSGEFGHGVAPL